MLNGKYVFKLEEESPVETEGGTVTANTVVGRSYTEGDYFDDNYVPTYIITGQNGGFAVKQDDVTSIIDITELPEQ